MININDPVVFNICFIHGFDFNCFLSCLLVVHVYQQLKKTLLYSGSLCFLRLHLYLVIKMLNY